jgi:hypothetical protein
MINQPQFDVFLCHNSQDKPEVRKIRDELRQQGINTWMDENNLLGFDDWQKKIEKNLSQTNTVAVFLGSSGLGEWQKHEITFTKQEISRRENNKLLLFFSKPPTLRAGLVILPSCKQSWQEIQNQYLHTPYGWLFKYHTVDLRRSDASVRKLIEAIKGQENDDLSSEQGVNYTRLRDLLAAGKWKEADEETLAVMLKASGREEEGWLNVESINKFPCTDLRTIDQLWVKYSNDRFGFSVQKRIWESVGGNPDADYETYCRFGEKVGWMKKGKRRSIDYPEEVIFNTSAPNGHLPCHPRIVVGEAVSSLASRLVKCNI